MPDLKPCPFCGEAPMVYEISAHTHSASLKRMIPDLPDHPGSWYVECCQALASGATREEAVAAWNRRAPRFTPEERDALFGAIQIILDPEDVTCSKVAERLRRMLEE